MAVPTSITAGGQPPGEIELLSTDLDEARRYFKTVLEEAGLLLQEVFPKFDWNYEAVQLILKKRKHHVLRKNMPVVAEEDVPALTDFILERHGHVRKSSHSEAKKLIPVQSQIYLDKIAPSIAKYGLQASIDFLNTTHIFSSKEMLIVDGHHRWLTAMLFNPDTKMLLYKMEMPAVEIFPLIFEFDQEIGEALNH